MNEELVTVLEDYLADPARQERSVKEFQDGSSLDGANMAACDFLTNTAIPKLLTTYGAGIFRPFRLCCLNCPDKEIPLLYVRILERFRASFPQFRYHLLVTDTNRERLDEAGKAAMAEVSDCGKLDLRAGNITGGLLKFLPPQDVVVCFEDLALSSAKQQKKMMALFSSLLFSGRFLIGHIDGIDVETQFPFDRLFPSVFRRNAETSRVCSS